MNRRHFLKSTALGAGAAATLSGCGAREEALIPLLVPEERIIPGVDKWTPSTCSICPAGCSTLVRSMAGEVKIQRDGQEKRQLVLQVKKIEGNPKSPINRGRLCARGQATPQVTYNPDRIRTPLKLAGPRGSGKYQPVSWDEALALLERTVVPAGAGLAAICGSTSQTRRQLVKEILTAAGSTRCYFEEPLGIPTLREANRRMFGRPQLESHDLESTHYLISFGANLLESHTSPVRYTLGLTHMRQGRPGERGKFVQVESRFSLTAANADEWLPARPGTEALVALSMAHVILKEELFDKTFVKSYVQNFEEYRAWVLQNYAPEKVADAVDIPSKQIKRVAQEFGRHHPAVALAGGTALAHGDGVFSALAIQSLNVLAGGVGKPGGIFWNTAVDGEAQSAAADPYWVEDFLASVDSVSALILLDADPIYSVPASMGLKEKLERIPFIVAFGTVLDDSSSHADLVLPDQTSLERWDIAQPEITTGRRVLTVTQPIIRPLYESRDSADVLLSLSRQLPGPRSESLAVADFREYLSNHLQRTNVLHGSFDSENLDAFWDTFLEEGVWTDSAPAPRTPVADLRSILSAEPGVSENAGSPEYPFYLQPFASVGLGTGREANLPWMQELPDPMTSVVWGSWVEMNPASAERLGIRDGEWVWLESPVGKIKTPVLLEPAARPDTVSIPFGQGHGTYGRYAGDKGVNAWQILMPIQVRGAGEAAWAETRVRVARSGEVAPLIRLGYDRERTAAEIHR